jgi:hypothetical protein
MCPLASATHAGIKTEEGTSPVCPVAQRPSDRVTGCARLNGYLPPPSVPWAQIMSAPTARALRTCLGAPTCRVHMSVSPGFSHLVRARRYRVRTMFITGMPASWSLSTAHLGGTPIAHTNRAACRAQSARNENAQDGTVTMVTSTHLLRNDNLHQLLELTPSVCALHQHAVLKPVIWRATSARHKVADSQSLLVFLALPPTSVAV